VRLILLALLGILFSACTPKVEPNINQKCLKSEQNVPPYSLEQLAIEQECRGISPQNN